MNNKIPTVDFRWGDKYKATEFIQPRSLEIATKAKKLNATGDVIDKVAAFIRDHFAYPLIGGQPSADGQFLRYRKSLLGYHWKKCVFYMWSFPAEVLLQKLGICIDTANLATSLLRAESSIAFTCLGQVRKTATDELLSYHAWTAVESKQQFYLLETTIHEPDGKNMITLHDAYHKDSDFATTSGIYYVEDARYDESQYIGTTDLGLSGIIFTLMGLPQKQLRMFGLERARQVPAKKLYTQWRKEEQLKWKEVSRAWRTI